MQDRPNTNCVSSMHQGDKDWEDKVLDSNNLTAQQNEEVLQLLEDVFSQLPNDYGKTTLIEHQIDTGEARPIRQDPRRIPHALREEIDNKLTLCLSIII